MPLSIRWQAHTADKPSRFLPGCFPTLASSLAGVSGLSGRSYTISEFLDDFPTVTREQAVQVIGEAKPRLELVPV